MTTVLSIGTTHPWNIAGIGLDLLVGAELDVRVLTVCTAASAQDERGLHALETLSADVVRAQLAAVLTMHLDAVRVGALTSPELVLLVAATLRGVPDLPVVVDPVMSASRGGTLADEPAIAMLRDEIATLPNVILTPNVPEAVALLGGRNVDRETLMQTAADLRALGSQAVLLKGGHLDGDPTDVLATADDIAVFEAPRIPGDVRGTGCLLAMSLACALGRREGLRDAIAFARSFVRKKIAGAREFGGLRVAY